MYSAAGLQIQRSLGTRSELKALKGAAGNDYAKVISFLEDYGDAAADVVQKIKNNPKLIDAWAKVDANPLNAAVHSATIKNIDYLEHVYIARTSSINGESLIQHIRGSFVKATHNGVDYKCGYKGFHIKEITEPNAITPITSVINGRTYMTGPAPTVNGLIQTAIKDGTIHNLSNSNVMKCEVLVWGYAGRKVGGNWVLDLDTAGNPVQCWVKKINNQGETTMFIGMTDDKILNEVAFARFNLELRNFVRPQGPTKFSNEWSGRSSEGFKINMYINPRYDFWTLPTNLPNLNTVYNSILR